MLAEQLPESIVFIDDPDTTIEQIAKLKLPELRSWLKYKVVQGDTPPASASEIQKMGKVFDGRKRKSKRFIR